MYDDYASKLKLYGKGFSYSGLLKADLKNKLSFKEVTDMISNNVFDVVVYGSLKHGLIKLEEVTKSHKNIVVLNGYDNNNNQTRVKQFNELNKYENVKLFSREEINFQKLV
jgi:hypothetical protein